MKFIFFGAGYCSRYIIPLLPKEFEIICTHNTKIKKQKDDKNFNLKRLCFNEFVENKKVLLNNVSFILNSIPPSPSGDIVINNFLKTIVENKKSLKWFGYFSSTSVYGNYQGKWVDENSKLKTTSERGIRRKNAEDSHMNLFNSYKIPIHIFRLPGIYGLGRSVFDKIKKNKAIEIIKKNHFFSRIHVEDIANAIILSLKIKTPGQIFNLSDDMPCESNEIVKYAAFLLKIKEITKINFDDPKVDKKIKSFYLDNKRVKNTKIKKILGWTPKYRNYKLGLREIFKSIS